MKNPWQILGLQPGASKEEIKKRYRELARKYHPDFNKSPDAELKMKEINEAYSMLINDNHKNQFSKSSFEEDIFFDDIFANFEDLFGIFNFGPHTKFYRKKEPKNEDLYTAINLSLKEGLQGIDNEFFIPSVGEKRRIRIPPGVEDGMVLHFSGEGFKNIPNIKPGDLYVKVVVSTPPQFKLKGMHLETAINVNIFDLMTGTERIIELPTDEKIKLVIPPGTKPGTKLCINNKGYCRLNDPYVRGNLYVKVNADVPAVTDPEIISKINELRKILGL